MAPNITSSHFLDLSRKEMSRQQRSFLSLKKKFIKGKIFFRSSSVPSPMFHWPQMGHKVQHKSCKGIADKGECDSRCKLRVTITYHQGLETPDPLTEKGDRGWLLDRQWTVYHRYIPRFSSWPTWWWEPALKIGRLPNRFWFLFPWGQRSGTSEFSKGPFIREIWIWILALSFALVGPRWVQTPSGVSLLFLHL